MLTYAKQKTLMYLLRDVHVVELAIVKSFAAQGAGNKNFDRYADVC
jgi:hypothetical protein